jgi:predicted metalloprotease with PDZ domain
MWARGLEDRPATIELPGGPAAGGPPWTAATQLYRGATPFEFTAPNLQYLMDSPLEFSPFVRIREFKYGPRTLRFALHHTGTDGELDSYVADVEKIVRQEGAVFGELPDYEPGSYTFIADYLPWADGDGMEHRNSTVMTGAGSIRENRVRLLDTVAHEFFHGWNVERIRPKSLEPFDFDRANMSGELWLAEGFTQYYGSLMMKRAGLVDVDEAARDFGGLVEAVTQSAGRHVRSAVEMSRMAPFIDGGRPVDRVNWANTVISYYPFGGAIALALDLSLRARSDGQLSLDDYMRALWRAFGKPGGSRPGYVDHPYTIADAQATLGDICGDREFARDFFARYIEGRDLPDYAPLLARAGLRLRRRAAGRAWLGDLRLEFRDAGHGGRVASLLSPAAALYAAGMDQDDELTLVDGERIGTAEALAAVLQRHKPGDRIDIAYVDRSGATKTARVTLAEDPQQDIVPVESTGTPLTPAQKSFRDAWLGPKRTGEGPAR